jgi:hypothetical protein
MGFYHSPKIVTDGLILALDAANTKSYPGSGTTWTDLSGNGNNGSLVNGPTFNSDNLGSIEFDGVSDYVDTGLALIYNFPFSFSFWINTTDTGDPFGSRSTSFTGSPLLIFRISSNDFEYRIRGSNGQNKQVFANKKINDGKWYYIVCTTSINSCNIFINSELRNTTSNNQLDINQSDVSFMIGARNNNGNSNAHTNILVSNFSFYNRALTSEEIQQNFNATKGRYGL